MTRLPGLGPPRELARARAQLSRRRAGGTPLSRRLTHVLLPSLRVSDEVADALAAARPVVALETAIFTHGSLGRLGLEDVIRAHGAVPAVCGILNRVPTVGLLPDEVERMVREGAAKVSRRDVAHLVGGGTGTGTGTGTGGPRHGGTTVASTMLLARLAGIRVFATGGLGGVHRGGHGSLDVSADLTELGRTRVAVICSGCKGFLDVARTLEVLETQGVLVATFLDGRSPAGPVDLPAFWARDSGVPSPSVLADEAEAAAVFLAQERLGIESGMVFANPVPEDHAIPSDHLKDVIETAVREAREKGMTGPRNTPYILGRIRDLTDGRSTPANTALVRSNCVRAAKVAVELARLLHDGREGEAGIRQ